MPTNCRYNFQRPLCCEETYQEKIYFPSPKQFYHPSPIIHTTSYPSLSSSKSSLPYRASNKFDACDECNDLQ